MRVSRVTRRKETALFMVRCGKWLTLAVNGPAPKDYDFKSRVIGGFGSPFGSLLSSEHGAH